MTNKYDLLNPGEDQIRVYIASPYTNGWMPDNVRLQLEAKNLLLDYGFKPFAPLENHFSEIYKKRDEGEWLEWDFTWLSACHIVIRIKGYDKDGKELYSPGADKEIALAEELNIPFFFFSSIRDLHEWLNRYNKKYILDNIVKPKLKERYNMSDGITEVRKGSYFDKNEKKLEKVFYKASNEQLEIFDLVLQEREYQKNKWGKEFDTEHTINDWATFINRYVSKAASDHGDEIEETKESLIKVAALAFAALESIKENNNTLPKRHYD
ncbi:MAG: hypothetical protein ACOC1K_02150 [Nanoarchaeota archaeon]